MHRERERERERGENERVRERAGKGERERRTHARAHTQTHVYTIVVLYATFVGFHNTYAGDFGTFVTPFTVARLVCQKHRDPDEPMMHIALAPTQASPPLQLRSQQMVSDKQRSATAASLPAPSVPILFARRSR